MILLLKEDDVEKIMNEIANLEKKIDLLSQSNQRPRFLWKEFWIGFSVVFFVMMLLMVVLEISHTLI